MNAELNTFDINQDPELARLARHVRASKRAVRLTDGEETVAVVTPAPETSKRRDRPGKRGDPVGFLRDLTGLGTSADGATDVSANTDHYLAEAYLPRKEA